MAFPINVSAGDGTDSSSQTGPYKHGSDLYIISNQWTQSALNIYKSTDAGLTYSPIAFNTGPFDGHIANNYWDTVLSLDGTQIIAVFYNGSGSVVRRFSMVSDTWGAASSAGPDTSAGLPSTSTEDPLSRVVLVPSGDLWYFYGHFPSVNQGLRYAVFSGSSWSSATTLVAATGTVFNYISAAFQDSNGLIHVYYRKGADEGLPAALYHITVSTGGVIGTEQVVDPTLRTFPTGRAFEIANQPNVVYYNSAARTGVWVGDTLNPSVFAFTLLNTISFPAEVVDIGPQVVEAGAPSYGAKGFGFVDSNGTAHVIWKSSNEDAFSFTVNAIYESTNSGSGWSAPVLLFDQTINPGGGTPPKLFGITANFIDGDLFVFADIDCGGLEFVAQSTPPSPPAVICDSPPQGTVGVPYSHFFPASGGTGPYTWAITSGSLPDGLTLDTATGEVSGTPTVADTFTFTVQVTDANDLTDDVTCSITIVAGLTILCNDPPDGQVGVPYDHELITTGGVPPYTYTISSGALPDGLAVLTHLSPPRGTITGTPTVAGTFVFTVHVFDAQIDPGPNEAFVTCSITIVATPGTDCPEGDIGGPG